MLRAVYKFIGEVQKVSSLRGFDPREALVLWDFRRENALGQWSCVCDRDSGGYSLASMKWSPSGTGAIFQGSLSTKLPADDLTKYSGYCAIKSKPLKSSWYAGGHWDLSEFDAFELSVRGDGRCFIANLQSPGLARKDDLWQCFVYTRGGPEWERITLPFADFLLTHRGYLQDHQMSFPRNRVGTFGLLLADRIDGPFALELQYIKAVRTLTPTKESHLD